MYLPLDRVMRKTGLNLVLGCLFAAVLMLPVSNSFGQSKVKERHLRGTWKLYIDLEEEMEKEETNVGARMILGAVDGLLGGIDIELEFHKDNQLKVMVDAYGDEDVEWGSWHIKEGKLYLDDSDSYSFDDTAWMLKKGRLQAYEYNDRGKLDEKSAVYMRRID